MRYDLEFKLVTRLTQTGLDTIAENLYGDSSISKMKWDTKTALEYKDINKGSINTSSYIPEISKVQEFIISGINNTTDNLKYIGNITNKLYSTPMFNGGKYSILGGDINWSTNTIVKTFDIINGSYTCEVDSDFDPISVKVFTLGTVIPGDIIVKKNFKFIEFNDLIYNSLTEKMSDTDAMKKTLEFIFKRDTASYKYTIKDNKVYLNIKEIKLVKNKIGVGGIKDTEVYALQEFPVKNVMIDTLTSDKVKVLGGFITTTNGVANNEDVLASYTVHPIISYSTTSRNLRPDIAFSNINMHQKMINNKSGTLCIGTSFGGTDIPIKIDITSNKTEIYGIEPFRISAYLKGVSNTPILNSDVELKIISGNATFSESGSYTLIKKTISDGSIFGDVVADRDMIGVYIQNNWVSGNKITIPFKIEDIDKDSTYLHFVTSDDPILGTKSEEAGLEPFVEKYNVDGEISSYSMNGRKIAYVSLQDSNGKLKSKFIKPTGIQYLENTASSKIDFTGTKHVDVFTAENLTEITYENNIPVQDNIAGYWLITNWNIRVEAKAIISGIEVESDIIDVKIQNIKSEESFTLNNSSGLSGASQLNAFGYFTISEYIKNPYGLNACSIYCLHSDCISKKCININTGIRKNFILDSGKVGCAHNTEYDKTHTPCPGLEEYLVNPFIMHLEGI